MTSAGIAMIAGGLATLIAFGRTMWSSWTGGTRRRRSSRAAVETSARPARSTRGTAAPRRGEDRQRVRPVLPAQAGAPDISGSQQAADILAGLAATDRGPANTNVGLAATDTGPANTDAGRAATDAPLATTNAELAATDAGLATANAGRAAARTRRPATDAGLAAYPIDDRDRSADAHHADGRRRRPRGGPMDMDDLRRQLRDALEDLRRESRDEPGPETGHDPWQTTAGHEEPALERELELARELELEPALERDPARKRALEPALEQELDPARARERRRLARAVLARADAGTREGARFDPTTGQLVRPPLDEAAATGKDPAQARPAAIGEDPARVTPAVNGEDPAWARLAATGGDPARARAADVLGDRVDGWVRPQYGTPEGPTGDYWKPVPHGAYTEDSSAYGWPVPVERLPAARGYPAPGDGAIEESEPTAVVPQWPPARSSDRIDLPRTWSVRRWDAETHSRDGWRPGTVAEVARRRPSPRPNAGSEVRSTVYVSRHAADPS